MTMFPGRVEHHIGLKIKVCLSVQNILLAFRSAPMNWKENTGDKYILQLTFTFCAREGTAINLE
jgi:hypothetical protein